MEQVIIYSGLVSIVTSTMKLQLLCIAVLGGFYLVGQVSSQSIASVSDCARTCNESCGPSKNSWCYCDGDCEIYKDCCLSRSSNCSLVHQGSPPYPPFQCHSISISELPTYRWMVSECPSEWTDQEVEKECIRDPNSGNFTTILPVSDGATGFVYRNEYCAMCNEIENVIPWGYDIECDFGIQALINNNEVTQSDVDKYCRYRRFSQPSFNLSSTGQPAPPARSCFPTIDQCLPFSQLQETNETFWTLDTYEDYQNRCKNSIYKNEVTSIYYRNEFCAFCNGERTPFCHIRPGFVPPTDLFPLSAVLNIRGDGLIQISSVIVNKEVFVRCPPPAVFNPFTQECRGSFMLPVFTFPELEIALPMLCDGFTVTSPTGVCECNGSLINLTISDSFSYIDSSTVLFHDEVYEIEFNTSEGNPVICVNFNISGFRDVNKTIPIFTYPVAYFTLSYIGCSLSVIGCVLILLTYTLFKELRTLPSKILMNLAVAILVSNLLILLGGPIVAAFPDVTNLCVSVAVLLHFFSLSQFSWMSMMSIELTRTFYRAFKLRTKESKHRKSMLLLTYIIVGWSIPLLITTVVVIVNFTTDSLVLYGVLPDGSRGSCWINHLESVVVAFIVPLALSLAFNILLFIVLTVFSCRASRSQAKLEKENKISYFRLNITIFSISGITWVFGFLAILVRDDWAWYVYIVLNSGQGFLICFLFLCTKHVLMLYIKLFACKKAGKEYTTTKQSAVVKTNYTLDKKRPQPIPLTSRESSKNNTESFYLNKISTNKHSIQNTGSIHS